MSNLRSKQQPTAGDSGSWHPQGEPRMLFAWTRLAAPARGYRVCATYNGALFVADCLTPDRPHLPFSVSQDKSGSPTISGELALSVDDDGAAALRLTIRDLKYPSGQVPQQLLAQHPLDVEPADANRGVIFKPIDGSVPVRAPLDTDVPPYCYVGQLAMSFPNGERYIGTGTLIEARNKADSGRYVLTCAHNLFDRKDGGRATRVSFQQGLNDQDPPPHPVIEAEDWFYPDDYPDVALSRTLDHRLLGQGLIEQSIGLDYGLVRLSEQIAVENPPLPTVYGDDALMDLKVRLCGLYGWHDHDEQMFQVAGRIDRVEPAVLGYPISTAVGTSGTAVTFGESAIVAVHACPGDEGDAHNYGARITSEVIERLNSWQA